MKKISDTFEPRFSIGTRFKTKHKEWEIVDYLRTYNMAGELMQFCYVAKTNVMGQDLIDYDVVDATIARSIFHETGHLICSEFCAHCKQRTSHKDGFCTLCLGK